MKRAVRVVAALIFATSAAVATPASAQAGGRRSPTDIVITDARVAEDGTVTLEVTTPHEPDGADFASSFAVLENGKPVEVHAEPVEGAPLVVVLVVDTSGSIAGAPLEAARAAATKFNDTVGDDVPVGVVTAGEPTRVLAKPTTQREATSLAIAALTATGGTSLLDSLVVASTTLGPETAAERHAIVLLTDGADTSSWAGVPMVTSELKASGVELIAIALDTPDQDLTKLEAVVDGVDGHLEVAPDEDSLDALFSSAARRLTNRWTLTYPTASEFSRASIAVSLPLGDEMVSGSTNVEISEAAVQPATVSTPPVSPNAYVGPQPTGLQNAPFAPWAAGAAVVLAIGLVAWAVAPTTKPERRLAVEDGVLPQTDGLVGLRNRVGAAGSALVDRVGYTNRLDQLLDESGVALAPGEAVAAAAGVALLFGAVGGLLGGAVGATVGVLLCLVILVVGPTRARAVRRRRFADQLADTLTLLAGSLRSGQGVGGAIDVIAAEAPSPMSDELARATLEARLGRPLTAALNGIAERMQSRDFTWVVEAIDVQREVGGNLANVLDRVSTTIRSRQRLRRQISAATAEGRLSATVLICLPIGITGILSGTNPEYMKPLFSETMGQLILAAAVALLVTGGVLLKRLVEPDL